MRAIAIGAVCLGLAACASTPDVRRLAAGTGLYVTSLAQGTDAFVSDQNQLNAENAAHLDRLARSSRTEDAEVRGQRVAWTLGGQRRQIAGFDAATALGAEAIVSRMSAGGAVPAAVSNQAESQYQAVSEALAKLSRKPKPAILLIGLLRYGAEVKSSYDDLADKAAAAAKTAAGKTNKTDGKAAASPAAS